MRVSSVSAGRRVASASALLAIVALAGCGGSGGGGDETFKDPAVPVTFSYPSSFQTDTDPSFSGSAGGSAAFTRALALDDDNAIVVETFDLTVAITPSNVQKVKPELDNVVDQLAESPASAKPAEFGGLPGFEYTIDLTNPTDGQSRLVFLFDGKTEIELNCQSTPEKRADLTEACDQMLSTLQKT
jgi:hypothetical protein